MQLTAPLTARPIQDTPAISGRSISLHLAAGMNCCVIHRANFGTAHGADRHFGGGGNG